MSPKIRRLLLALLVLAAAAAVATQFLSHDVPAGQSPLATLDQDALDALRGDFNRASDATRIVLLLSPTWATCLRGASAVQSLLEQRAPDRVRVFAVWQPMLPTDVTAPTTSVLGRLSDVRVRQYWDEHHALAKRMKDDARDPQPAQECCVRKDILWDLAAVYPPGALWNDRLPPAVVFNGPVVDVTDAIAKALGTSRQ